MIRTLRLAAHVLFCQLCAREFPCSTRRRILDERNRKVVRAVASGGAVRRGS